MFIYSQARGLITHNGHLEGTGYSGHGIGLNNGALEAEPNMGPIPKGMWKIIRWDAVHGNKGPCVAVLEPVGHDAHGRSAFLVHGPHENDAHDSSDGCIIAYKLTRQNWRDSGDMDLQVVA